MAQLVGDILTKVREAGPDPASPLSPSTIPIVAAPAATGGFFPNKPIYLSVSMVNPWGESDLNLVSVVQQNNPPAAATIAAQNATEVEIDFTNGSNIGSVSITAYPPPGATGFRVYFGFAPGQEFGYLEFSGVNVVTIQSMTGLIAGTPPTRATGMNPDSDGSFVSAATLYRWLNMGLRRAGRISGGIKDITGVAAVAGRGMYQIPSTVKGPPNANGVSCQFATSARWLGFGDCWYDGWPLDFGRRKDVFLHGQVGGVSGYVTWETLADSMTFQLWPQPTRPGAFGQITTPSGLPATTATDTEIVFAYADQKAQFIDIGLVQIDNEVIAYNGIEPYGLGFNYKLKNCIRGLGGTTPASHVPGTFNVMELNIRLGGHRMPNQFSVGQSALPINVPEGWYDALDLFMLAEYKNAEQDVQTAMALMKEFDGIVEKSVKMGREQPGPRQIGGEYRRVYPGGLGGGLIVP